MRQAGGRRSDRPNGSRYVQKFVVEVWSRPFFRGAVCGTARRSFAGGRTKSRRNARWNSSRRPAEASGFSQSVVAWRLRLFSPFFLRVRAFLFFRAFESPASESARWRLLTFPPFPPRPLFAVLRRLRRISLSTSRPALRGIFAHILFFATGLSPNSDVVRTFIGLTAFPIRSCEILAARSCWRSMSASLSLDRSARHDSRRSSTAASTCT